MNEDSSDLQTPVRNGSGVALLIDGENVSHEHAEAILRRSNPRGAIAVKRVYGNVSKMPGWESTPGFRIIHSGSGKNSADMMLVIDALDLAHTGSIVTFIIVSSDRDFSHLSFYLRERHFTVIGVGEAKSVQALRQSFLVFAELKPLEDKKASIPPTATRQVQSNLDQKLHDLIRSEPCGGGKLITDINALIRRSLSIKISARPEKTWRNYFVKNEHLYSCDPRGPNARVRLVSKS